MAPHNDLQQYNDFGGVPQVVALVFRLTRGGRVLVCELSTHPLGWALRASDGGDLPRTQVCKTEEEVFATTAAWKQAALDAGWTV